MLWCLRTNWSVKYNQKSENNANHLFGTANRPRSPKFWMAKGETQTGTGPVPMCIGGILRPVDIISVMVCNHSGQNPLSLHLSGLGVAGFGYTTCMEIITFLFATWSCCSREKNERKELLEWSGTHNVFQQKISKLSCGSFYHESPAPHLHQTDLCSASAVSNRQSVDGNKVFSCFIAPLWLETWVPDPLLPSTAIHTVLRPPLPPNVMKCIPRPYKGCKHCLCVM